MLPVCPQKDSIIDKVENKSQHNFNIAQENNIIIDIIKFNLTIFFISLNLLFSVNKDKYNQKLTSVLIRNTEISQTFI